MYINIHTHTYIYTYIYTHIHKHVYFGDHVNVNSCDTSISLLYFPERRAANALLAAKGFNDIRLEFVGKVVAGSGHVIVI